MTEQEKNMILAQNGMLFDNGVLVQPASVMPNAVLHATDEDVNVKEGIPDPKYKKVGIVLTDPALRPGY